MRHAPPKHGIAVLGGGPAGLTAGLVLARRGVQGRVFEADRQVGGIAKTVERGGFRFDLGGHRFFTKLGPVAAPLGADARRRVPRPAAAFADLLPRRVLRVPAPRRGRRAPPRCSSRRSAAPGRTSRPALRRGEPPVTFEDWVTARFGRRLYNAFFREYTEKVWGIPGSEIQSEWAAQRIRNLSFWTALTSAIGLQRTHVTSLIEEFHYPRLGPGQMWEAIAGRPRAGRRPGRARDARDAAPSCGRARDLDRRRRGRTASARSRSTASSRASRCPSSSCRSTRCRRTTSSPRPERLRYRDLIVVGLVSSDPEPFPDNWIYLHDPGTRAGRVQNFGAWSAGMTRPGFTCLGVEYFCFAGDELWDMPGQRARAARRPRARPHRPARPGARRRGHGDPGPARVPDVRRRLPRRRRRLRRRSTPREPRDGRPKRAPPVQQPGPLDVDRGARRRSTCSTGPTTTSGR